jgi:hypothetical protein
MVYFQTKPGMPYFLGTIDQHGKKYTKQPLNILNVCKIYQIAVTIHK